MMNTSLAPHVRSGRLLTLQVRPPKIRMAKVVGALSWLVAVSVLPLATRPLFAAPLETQSSIDTHWEMRFGGIIVRPPDGHKSGPAPIGGVTEPFGHHDPIFGSWTGANSGVARGVSAGPVGIGPSTFSAEAASAAVASGHFADSGDVVLAFGGTAATVTRLEAVFDIAQFRPVPVSPVDLGAYLTAPFASVFTFASAEASISGPGFASARADVVLDGRGLNSALSFAEDFIRPDREEEVFASIPLLMTGELLGFGRESHRLNLTARTLIKRGRAHHPSH